MKRILTREVLRLSAGMLLGAVVTLLAQGVAISRLLASAPEDSIPATEITTVTIRADRGWQPTGVTVHRGQRLSITYLSGKWSQCGGYGGEACLYTDADGLDFESPHDNVMKSGCADARLIARVGNAPPLCIGGNFSGMVQHSGALELRINDDILGDNAGYIVVQIAAASP